MVNSVLDFRIGQRVKWRRNGKLLPATVLDKSGRQVKIEVDGGSNTWTPNGPHYPATTWVKPTSLTSA